MCASDYLELCRTSVGAGCKSSVGTAGCKHSCVLRWTCKWGQHAFFPFLFSLLSFFFFFFTDHSLDIKIFVDYPAELELSVKYIINICMYVQWFCEFHNCTLITVNIQHTNNTITFKYSFVFKCAIHLRLSFHKKSFMSHLYHKSFCLWLCL